ncbi:MHS family metabolite:H+ symporter-like MFS transporter [Paraburkholderia sp. BL6669N2]|uniref:MFS transporter n=1 Tax=unclassified Paraburkholderia TaxID=2615204 RepID=UPI000D07B428|nr:MULTISPECIES: MFS transporter [unclassified Paraburkholderia]PRY09232.1 MHS family metabolite:H+ symporter-like MFS transporter [Paraburkholderia sp. BL25I1N1]REG51890.1 MHS family metabolite:H+ symporter-like MFS transporter [Paraburkholderia sp. BL6669N2]TDY20961.1 MHS family metabolite:H+ symporter-like MFS transporter [Paraburkholderia sp. BL6665CI2N2]
MAIDPRAIRRVAFASVIGATVEWYDFFLYGVVAGIVFNKLYFPASDPLVSTLLAYSTFAVGFVTRPLGGVIFGHFGDRIGRKSALILTLIIMGISTAGVAFVPTYAQIGIWAPILLLSLRVLQGIGLGGEWGGAVLMAYEYAPPEKRGLYASLPQIGLSIGLCLASGMVAALSRLLPETAFLSWGWRIAFGASLGLVLIGLYIRAKVMETPEFLALKRNRREAKIPFVDMITRYRGAVVLGMGARYIDGVFFNIFAVFSIGYLTQHVSMSRTDALLGVMIAAGVMCFFIPLFGSMSDKLGRARVYFWGSLICGVSVFPAFWLIEMQPANTLLIWAAIVVPFGIFYAMVYGPEAALFAELFDAEVRYTGISFVYQFSGIFASGLTPIIATILMRLNGGKPWTVCAYVLFSALISALSVRAIERKRAGGFDAVVHARS